MKRTILFYYFAVFSMFCSAQRKHVDLSGEWGFSTKATKEQAVSNQLTDKILLPGSMPQRFKGDLPSVNTVWTGSLYDSSYFHNPYMAKYREVDNFKLPFFLTPTRHYVGDAWYVKKVHVPADFAGKRVLLYIERPHITSTLYINKKEVGTQNSLSVCHEYDVTDYVKAGQEATICLKINNETKYVGVGQDSHSVSDQTQGNWNGMAGLIELRSIPLQHISHVDVYPDFTSQKLTVRSQLAQSKLVAKQCRLSFYVTKKGGKEKLMEFSQVAKFNSKGDSALVEVEQPLNGKLLPWDEFTPNLYTLHTEIVDKKGNVFDRDEQTFGLRTITCKGKDILVNGRMTMMRGTVENCDFPMTGYAPTDKASWMQVFQKCKDYGLNHMRFHSYCPPEVAFEAADELGFYLQPEGPSWPNHGVKLGNGQMIDKYLMEETQRIVERYGNHPSFTMLSCGNEPAGNWVAWVSRFVDYWKKTDSRRIYTGASVGGSWAWQPKNQYHVKAGARGLDDWRKGEPHSMGDFSHNIDTVSQPFISHEMGQWCAFPDLDEVEQYDGAVNVGKNFEIFRDILTDNGMACRAKQFLNASGKLQVLCYKHEIEKTLRTPHYAGYQLLGLNDYSGQGTALVGPLNVFWREKGYVTDKQWRTFSSPITLLARFPKFTFWSEEEFPISLEVSNYGEGVITGAKIRGVFVDDKGEMLSDFQTAVDSIGMGLSAKIGEYVKSFKVTEPKQITFKVKMAGVANSKAFNDVYNDWTFWVYPKHSNVEISALASSAGVMICKDTLDAKAEKLLKRGGRVLVILDGKTLSYGKGIQQHYLPVFWNTSWFKMKPPHTTGMYIENEHPLFKNFPTEDFSDLQWWSLMNRKPVMLMDRMPAGLQPIVQPIDTWFLSRKLGMLFEARVGKGKVLVTTLPIETDAKHPVINQMSYAIFKYVSGNDFEPAQEISVTQINELFKLETPAVNMYTKDSPDELKKGVR